MKMLRAMAFATVGMMGLSAAGIASAKEDDAKWSHRFEPCSYWRYDFNTNTYTCSQTAFAIEVPDAQEFNQLDNTVTQLQQVIQQLQQTIQTLEQRVQTLERRP